MKVGIIRCMQTEDYCPGQPILRCLKNIRALLKVSMKKLS